MKIAIIGFSGSGKSTLAQALAKKFNIPVLHFDQVQFLPGWKERTGPEKLAMTREFLDRNADWVIDGNYTNLLYERRMAEADQIVLLAFDRVNCLFRLWRRYRRYRGRTREDMAPGCPEKLDAEFLRWVLWDSRTGKRTRSYRDVRNRYPEKLVILNNQRELDRYARSLGLQ